MRIRETDGAYIIEDRDELLLLARRCEEIERVMDDWGLVGDMPITDELLRRVCHEARRRIPRQVG